MKNSDYWKQRFFQLEYAQTAESAKTTKAVQRAYQSAHKEILNEIYSWYGRFAKNNGVTMSQARQLLKADELEEFHWSVEQYIKRGKECAVNNQKWFKELENASAKFHITRLEALETNLKANLEILAAQKDNLVSGAVKDAFRTSYYKSCFEVQRGFNVGFDIGKIDEDKLEKLIRKPWATDGYNFSERIWRDKNKLINIAHQEITKSVMLGGAPDKAIKSISQAMNTSEYNARRLVMTENSYFGALGEKKMYEEFEFEKYEVIAAHSAAIKTCETCAEMDGKVFLTRDLTPGLNANPFHPNCHCTTVPYFDDFNDGEMRFARGKDGKGYYIPSDMKYPEWKEKFVDGGNKAVNENRMSAYENDWSGAETLSHTPTELKELNEYATNKGIKLYNRKPFEGDIELLKCQIDTVAKLREEFKITEPIQIGWKRMSLQDFGETSSNHQQIWLNEVALRNRAITENNLRADNYLAAEIAEGIAAHEMGHVISGKIRNGKTGLDIYKEAVYNVSGEMISDKEALLLLGKNVSEYSASVTQNLKGVNVCDEIISEMVAVNYTKPNKYSREFVRLLREACGL